jgi:hypothetical protein
MVHYSWTIDFRMMLCNYFDIALRMQNAREIYNYARTIVRPHPLATRHIESFSLRKELS